MDNPAMTPEVQEAIQRRAGGAPTPQLAQTSAQAPMQGDPAMSPMPMSQMTASSTPPAGVPATKFEPKDKTDLVLMALTEFLKNDHKLQKQQMEMGQGQQLPIM